MRPHPVPAHLFTMQIRLARHVMIVTSVALLLAFATGLIIANVDALESFVALVFLAGTGGGIANNFRHMKKVDVEASSEEGTLAVYQIYLSPLVGGVFGLVSYGIFAAGLLQGDAFPKFDGAVDFAGAQTFADTLLPVTSSDAAKALFWAFVAGFAEWLVPNFIDSIAKSNSNGGNAGT